MEDPGREDVWALLRAFSSPSGQSPEAISLPESTLGRALRQGSEYLPPGYSHLIRALGGLFDGPSVPQQQADWQAALDRARAGGAPLSQALAAAGESPIGAAVAGATQGVRPARLQNMWHGTDSNYSAREIAREGFRRGGSAELSIRGTSVSDDPSLSLANFAGGDPDNMLRVRTTIDPRTVRNLSPGQYAAFGTKDVPAPRPGDAPAYSKPQSYYSESEIFWPTETAGQATLTATPADTLLMRRLNEELTRRRELLGEADMLRDGMAILNRGREGDPASPSRWGGRANIWDALLSGRVSMPVPSALQTIMNDRALLSSRSDRPMFHRAVTEMASPMTDSGLASGLLEQIFPQRMRQIASVEDQARQVRNAYDRQSNIGRTIATYPKYEPLPPRAHFEIREQNNAYRNFVRQNENLYRMILDNPVGEATGGIDSLLLRDVMRNLVGNPAHFSDLSSSIANLRGNVPNLREADLRRVLRDPTQMQELIDNWGFPPTR